MRSNVKNIVEIVIVSVFFLLIIGYALYRSHDIISGVQIQNVNITNGAKMTNSILPITGNAKNAVNLTLNGREITIDQRGNFSETIALHLGYNVVTIRAIDKFGYSDEKNYKLMY